MQVDTEVMPPQVPGSMLAAPHVRESLAHPSDVLGGVSDMRLVDATPDGYGGQQRCGNVRLDVVDDTLDRIVGR